MIRRILTAGAAGAGVLAAASPALAHTYGIHGGGFGAGFFHPLGGLDHVLAMVAVGIWAAQIGGRAMWLVPAAFVAAMIGGGLVGMVGIPLPMIELGIVASVVLLGGLIALQSRLPLSLSMALVALFALFHGHAHGLEAPTAAAPMLYASGFALATALLHRAGIGLAVVVSRLSAPLLRLAGGAIAAGGLALAAGI
ncbi:HupE/UreJ family protein [Rhodospirillaceae bacterium SYSU D60014]|uniref:HupE/UreJ family protein n=1 Tax=Virgifigura deserti TaxID=2268457 RepID=UPI000E671459